MMTSTTSGYWPGCLAPSFSATTVFSGSTSTIDLQSFKGKMVLLIFYPVDFGYICPTELMAVEDKLLELKQEECKVLAISTGSILSKVAFQSLGRVEGGVSGIKFGLVEDKEGEISHMYGVMREDSGYSYRAMVIIDREGMVLCRMVSDLSVGCGITEALRLVKASKHDMSVTGLKEKKENIEEERNTSEVIGKTEVTGKPSAAFGEARAGDTANVPRDDTEKANSNHKDEQIDDTDVERSTGPEMCECSLSYPHSVNHHQKSTLKKKEH